MPYIPPHLREGYVPAAPATAEMLGINAKSQMIRPNIAPVGLTRTRPFKLPTRYHNTIELHRRRSYKHHKHPSRSRKRSKSRSRATRRR
jgi:hypothetical protein